MLPVRTWNVLRLLTPRYTGDTERDVSGAHTHTLLQAWLRLTCLGSSAQGFAGSRGVGGDDSDAVLRPAQQIDNQHGVHVITHEGLQRAAGRCQRSEISVYVCVCE